MSVRNRKPTYGLHGPVRLTDGRAVIFLCGASKGCCHESWVLTAEDVIEVVNPDDVRAIRDAPYTFDARWYSWYRKKVPLKGWARFSQLKAVADQFLALDSEGRISRYPKRSYGLDSHFAFPNKERPCK